MEAHVKQLNKDIGNINTLTVGKNIKEKHKDELERIYKMKRGGYQQQERKSRKKLRQRTKNKRDIKVESTSINKTAPSWTIKKSFTGS